MLYAAVNAPGEDPPWGSGRRRGAPPRMTKDIENGQLSGEMADFEIACRYLQGKGDA